MPAPDLLILLQKNKKGDLSCYFGPVLREHGERAKVTQEWLSEEADVDVRMIRFIETKGKNLSVNLADRLAQSLKISLASMIAEAEAQRDEEVRTRPESSK